MRRCGIARRSAVAPSAAPVGCVLSIAAGTRSADIAQWLGGFDRVVRAMPNTPAMVGKGIAGVHAQPAVDPAQRDAAAAVLEAEARSSGSSREAMLDAVTGVSGSGPAYVFYFLEALETAARAQGFAPADARRLAYATFDGAVALAKASAEDPATLRAQVTSKGGTTERGIAALDARRGPRRRRRRRRRGDRAGGRTRRRELGTAPPWSTKPPASCSTRCSACSPTRSCCASRCSGCARRSAIRSGRR